MSKPPSEPPPQVIRCELKHSYDFMYEAAVFADQGRVHLFLDHAGDGVRALAFDGVFKFKFGAPNDEALGGHPLAPFGLRFFDFFEVLNSPWIADLCRANRVHPNHNDALFANKRHFIATFKDTTFEVVCRYFEERQMSFEDVQTIMESAIPRLKI